MLALASLPAKGPASQAPSTSPGSKRYQLHGTLFFAFTAGRHLSFVAYSAIAALETLRECDAKAGKQLLHLSDPCRRLLKRAWTQPE